MERSIFVYCAECIFAVKIGNPMDVAHPMTVCSFNPPTPVYIPMTIPMGRNNHPVPQQAGTIMSVYPPIDSPADRFCAHGIDATEENDLKGIATDANPKGE